MDRNVEYVSVESPYGSIFRIVCFSCDVKSVENEEDDYQNIRKLIDRLKELNTNDTIDFMKLLEITK